MASFLAQEGGRAGGNQRFVARNFLLDEGVSEDRFRSYAQAGCVAEHATFEDWKGLHEGYFRERVARPSTGTRHESLDARDPDTCPETFRHIAVDSRFHTTDANQHLVRLVQLSFIAERTGESLADLKRWTERVVAAPLDRSTDEFQQLDAALHIWNEMIDSWPTFAAFWEEVRGLWEPTEHSEWADELRDWLGLAHLNPVDRGIREIDVIVFRYPVSAVPRLTGSSIPKDSRPLVTPTVLDGYFSHAFCPSPRGQLTGHTVALNERCEQIRQEVLHPNVEFRASHVWRLGAIRRRIDLDRLATFRGYHLLALRDHAGRPDYATRTDADISL